MSASEIDRIAPMVRPSGPAVMYQRWSQLLFLHWEVPVESLAALLPPGLELDTFDGKAYVGLVPFTMQGVRPRGLPSVGWLSNFHETNVRTYVRVGNADPGVWFFSLDAANPIAVMLARRWFHLPYFYATMSLTADEAGAITYSSIRRVPGPNPPFCRVQARPMGRVEPAGKGTLEHFLAERYILYAAWSGGLVRGRVHHSPYPLQRAEVLDLEENLVASTTIVRPDLRPIAHFASGVSVEVFRLENMDNPTQKRPNAGSQFAQSAVSI